MSIENAIDNEIINVARFDDFLGDSTTPPSTLEMQGFIKAIRCTKPSDLKKSFEEIEEAARQGAWVVIMADYELGFWIEPTAAPRWWNEQQLSGYPGISYLNALVFKNAHKKNFVLPSFVLPSLDSSPPQAVELSYDTSPDQYTQHIEIIKSKIQAGDCYQVNYTFPTELHHCSKPFDLYCHLGHKQPVRYAAYIQDKGYHGITNPSPGRVILSLSPELFLYRSSQGYISVKPMKGTAARLKKSFEYQPNLSPAELAADLYQARELLMNEKNRAENLMIVDLLRNDLGRISRPGSVKVQQLFEVEAYPSVWQMTSTITSQAATTSLYETFQALFPSGSITGAPKIAAMRIAAELEARPRGLYCGAIGYLAPDSSLKLNVAIRTVLMDAQGHSRLQVGSGIVLDSEPRQEWQECLLKTSFTLA